VTYGLLSCSLLQLAGVRHCGLRLVPRKRVLTKRTNEWKAWVRASPAATLSKFHHSAVDISLDLDSRSGTAGLLDGFADGSGSGTTLP